jgi:hypothetical protein
VAGDRVFFHLVRACCLPGEMELPDAGHRAAYVQEQEQHQQRAAQEKKAGTSTAKKWGGTSNENRASVFVKWLLETYSLSWLASGIGVLDVAGGSGQVAWSLTCLRRCPSVIIDPRPAITNSKQRAYLRYNCNDAEPLCRGRVGEGEKWVCSAVTNAEPPQAIRRGCRAAPRRSLPPSHRACLRTRTCTRDTMRTAPSPCALPCTSKQLHSSCCDRRGEPVEEVQGNGHVSLAPSTTHCTLVCRGCQGCGPALYWAEEKAGVEK